MKLTLSASFAQDGRERDRFVRELFSKHDAEFLTYDSNEWPWDISATLPAKNVPLLVTDLLTEGVTSIAISPDEEDDDDDDAWRARLKSSMRGAVTRYC